MNNKNILSATLYVILFVSLFILIQSLSFKGGKELVSLLGGTEAADGDYLTKNGETLAITAVISSLATFILFIATKWAPVSGNYLKTRPWAVLMWSALIALGSILPLQFLAEKEEEYSEKFANPYQAAQFGYIDDVIEPRNTRFRRISRYKFLLSAKDLCHQFFKIPFSGILSCIQRTPIKADSPSQKVVGTPV